MWTRLFFTLMLGLLLTVALGNFRAVAASPAAETDSAHSLDTHAAHGETKGPLYIDRSISFWTGALFVVLFIVLYFIAWKPISEGLDTREKHIGNQIAQANAANQQAKELLAQHEKKLAEAAQEVRTILDKARNDAEEAAREREAKAEADAKARIERAEKEIAAATAAAAKELADRSAKLAVDLAGKIVQTKLNAKDHAQLIEQAVSGFNVSREAGKFASRN